MGGADGHWAVGQVTVQERGVSLGGECHAPHSGPPRGFVKEVVASNILIKMGIANRVAF
jgi:hypothetical protein